ncbi:MAG TPA: zinc-ribbon domain-containing protein [Candidatus Eisenbacteria bacterium]|nr:zinc-ribbon domain-containing protein [Candidatus Eisenbacteria bacterium]
MKLDCASCGARYSIDESLIPPQGAKIKCRKCGTVIAVPPRVEPAPVATTLVPPTPQQQQPPPPAAAPAAPAPAASGFSFFSSQETPAAAYVAPAAPAPAVHAAPAPAPVAPAPAAPPQVHLPPPPAPSHAASFADAPPAVAAPVPQGLAPEEQARHEKARRLARVLASDIAIYNREKKERGLSDGNLVAVLGYEIKKSWEIYKERVGADFANSTPYFRDALNDLLAEGKKIF